MTGVQTCALPIFSILTIFTVGIFVSSCSSSGGGGSVSGSGSSSVEGNVSSITLAMLKSTESEEYSTSTEEYSLLGFLKSLLTVQSAFADGTIEGVHVAIGQLGTTTNSSGYFRINGVPPGTHEIVFSKYNQVARTSITVGENELCVIQDVSLRGSQAHMNNVEYRHKIGRAHV